MPNIAEETAPAASENEVRRGRRLAVVSLVCGLVAAFTPIVGVPLGLVAIVCGHKAMARLHEPAAPTHSVAGFLTLDVVVPGGSVLTVLGQARGRALVGLVMGYFSLALSVLVVALAYPYASKW